MEQRPNPHIISLHLCAVIADIDDESFSGSNYSKDASKSFNSAAEGNNDRSFSESRHASVGLEDGDLSGRDDGDRYNEGSASARDDHADLSGSGGSRSQQRSEQGSFSAREEDFSGRKEVTGHDEKIIASGQEDEGSHSRNGDVNVLGNDGENQSGPDDASQSEHQSEDVSISEDSKQEATEEVAAVNDATDVAKSTDVDPEKKLLIAEIRQLHEVGTQVMVLEQMFDPAIVAEAVAQADEEKEGTEKESPSHFEAKDNDSGASAKDERQKDNDSVAPVESDTEAPVDVERQGDGAAGDVEQTKDRAIAGESSQAEPAGPVDISPVNSEKLKALEMRIGELESSLSDSKKYIDELEQKNGDLQKTCDSVLDENTSLKDKNKSLQTTCDDLNSQIEEIQQQNKTLQSTCDELDKNNSSFESICDELKKSLRESEKKNSGLQGTCDELKEWVSE